MPAAEMPLEVVTGSGHGQVQGQAARLVHRHPSWQHVMGTSRHHVTLSSIWGPAGGYCPGADGETESPLPGHAGTSGSKWPFE